MDCLIARMLYGHTLRPGRGGFDPRCKSSINKNFEEMLRISNCFDHYLDALFCSTNHALPSFKSSIYIAQTCSETKYIHGGESYMSLYGLYGCIIIA
jgi:hypothetical protein